MAPARRRIQRILELASRVEDDIQERRLRPGDRYLSTGDTAKMLRVDTATANRALQLLVKRNVLRRRQRVGTFVAEPHSHENQPPLGRVHLLMSDAYAKAEGWLDTDALLDLQSELPGVQLQFHLVRLADEQDYLNRVIHDALSSRVGEGFVLARSTLTTQRMIVASGLPAVVFGHPYASVKGLSFVDRDQREMGRLMARFVLRRGHRRIVALMRDRLLPGDHELLDGAREIVEGAELPAPGLWVRCLPHDREEVVEEVGQLLDASPELPGIISRPPLMAEAAIEALQARNLIPMHDVAIAVSDYFREPPPGLPFAVIRPALETDQQGARLGRVIAQLARRELPKNEHRLTPVRLEVPSHCAVAKPPKSSTIPDCSVNSRLSEVSS